MSKIKNGKFAAPLDRGSIRELFIDEGLLKAVLTGGTVFLGYTAGLVEMGFLAPVMVVLLSTACFRIGRWQGWNSRKTTQERS